MELTLSGFRNTLEDTAEARHRRDNTAARFLTRTKSVQDGEPHHPLVGSKHAGNSCTIAGCAVTASLQRNSALDSLLSSLEQGMHESEAVVPVHRYLPRIKVPCWHAAA